jgi:hypothetical protein
MAIDEANMSDEAREICSRLGLIGRVGARPSRIIERDVTPRKQAGREPTQLEVDFGSHLSTKRFRYEIIACWTKPMVLRIGPDMTFEPDFMVEDLDGQFWLVDTKGPHAWEDSRIKIKIAAEKFACWGWLIVTRSDDRCEWRAKEVTRERGIARRYSKIPWINGA